jgi:hypothetical protein
VRPLSEAEIATGVLLIALCMLVAAYAIFNYAEPYDYGAHWSRCAVVTTCQAVLQ